MIPLGRWLGLDASLPAEVIVKASLLLAFAGVLSAALRGATAATRHTVWLVGLITVLVLPAAVVSVPDWWVPVLAPAEPKQEMVGRPVAPPASVLPEHGVQGSARVSLGTGALDAPSSALPETYSSVAPSSEAPAPRPRSQRWLLGIWLLGVSAWLVWLLGGAAALGRIARRSQILNDEEPWRALLEQEAADAGVRRPVRLLRSPAVASPVSWGLRTPILLLPIDCDAWSVERRRVVLRHELAHVARRDSSTQLVAACACGLYWFHPLAWWAARRLRSERERACDDRVLASGVKGADYAAHLLAVARTASALRLPTVVTASMAHQSELEARVIAAMDPRRRRGAPSVAGRWGIALGAIGVALSTAAFRAIPRGASAAAPPAVEAVPQGAIELAEPAPPRPEPTPQDPQAPLQSPAPPPQAFEVRDSAGVRIVQHGTVAGRAAFRISEQPVYRITGLSATQPFQFPGLGVLLSDGSAVVMDGELRQLAFLSPDGTVEAVRGGEGTGPGQFEGVFAVLRLAGDTVVVQNVRYGAGGKLMLYHDRELVREVPVEGISWHGAVGVGGAGEMLLGLPPSYPAQRSAWLTTELVRLDLEEAVLDTVGTYELVGPTLQGRFEQNGPIATAAGQFVIGRSDRPELRWIRPDGTLRQVVRWQRAPLAIPGSVWDAQRDAYRGRYDSSLHIAGLRATLDEAPFFRRLIGDSEGNVWLGTMGFPIDYWRPAGYDVISPQGIWLGSVPAPRDFQVLAIGGDRILGYERETKTVVMYRIER